MQVFKNKCKQFSSLRVPVTVPLPSTTKNDTYHILFFKDLLGGLGSVVSGVVGKRSDNGKLSRYQASQAFKGLNIHENLICKIFLDIICI